jgi:hypothetical protein
VASERIRGEGVHRRRAPDGPRRQRVEVLLSPAEATELKRRAARSGVSLARYLIGAALDPLDTPAERHMRSVELLAVHRMLRGIGTNINQLAKIGNAHGFVPAGTTDALAALRSISERVEVLTQGSEREVPR